jgi:hypothetical protein
MVTNLGQLLAVDKDLSKEARRIITKLINTMKKKVLNAGARKKGGS